jgi:hypothetical protein
VPTGAPQAVRWFVDSVWTPRSRRERWLGRLAARLPAAAALSLLARGSRARGALGAADTGRRLLRAAAGDQASGSCALGWSGYAGTGRALDFVFLAGESLPRWVLKWGRMGVGASLSDERDRLVRVRTLLAGTSADELVETLPEPLAYGVDGEHEWLLLSALQGRTLDADLARAPRDGARGRRHLVLGAEWLGRFHGGTEPGPEAGRELELAPGELGAELESLARAIADGALPRAASHGDFWPRNILVTPDLARVSGVVDWESARAGGLAHGDLFDFVLSYAALVAEGAGAERAMAAFRLAILSPEAFAGGVRAGLDAYAETAGLAPRWLEPLFRLYLSELAAGARELRLAPAPDRPEVARTWIALYANAKRSVFSG